MHGLEICDEAVEPPLDVVPDPSHLVECGAGRIADAPVEMPRRGRDLEPADTAAHRHDDVCGAEDLRREGFRELLGDVDPDLLHGGTDVVVDRRGVAGACRVDGHGVTHPSLEERSGHPCPTSARDADEDHLGDRFRERADRQGVSAEPLARKAMGQDRDEGRNRRSLELAGRLLDQRPTVLTLEDALELLRERLDGAGEMRLDVGVFLEAPHVPSSIGPTSDEAVEEW